MKPYSSLHVRVFPFLAAAIGVVMLIGVPLCLSTLNNLPVLRVRDLNSISLFDYLKKLLVFLSPSLSSLS